MQRRPGNTICFLGALAAVTLVLGDCAQAAPGDPPLLHAMFRDRAVVQRDQPIRVWGRARPGESVKVDFAGKSARARADKSGRWEAQLPALHAGGPYTLTAASGGTTQTANDVLVGDVWLCSGQSNMVLEVKRTLDSRSEMADAHNDAIRMMTVRDATSPVPLDTFVEPAPWLTTTPESIPDFSAACFYFARELQRTVAVPMGLINDAWGGARIEAWMSASALRAVGGYDEPLDIVALYARDPLAAAARWGARWAAWWHAQAGVATDDEPWNPRSPRGEWHEAPPALGDYQQWGVPALADYNGVVWYRTNVTLSAAQAARGATLAIGSVDEIDETWVDGRLVGSSYGGELRDYALPRGLLHEGDNTIVVNALNTYKGGGVVGPASTRALKFADGSSVPLDGVWRYRTEPRGSAWPPGAPWTSAYGVSTLYNGMLAPVGPYGVRGALWYQGESNTGNPGNYRALLRGLRNDLRAHFGAQLPLLVVQLANYGHAPTRPGESQWAELREAQRLAVGEDARSGLAVTIDIGDRYDIHPPNKQEVGRRLARAARHVIYGEGALPVSGPVPKRARHDGDAVAVAFADVTDGLVAYGADGPIGFELCAAQAGTCRYASAEIHADEVILRASNATSATRVRYGWGDSPIVTLFDGAGLPAGPFEIPLPYDVKK
ncbi:MAG TPA: sialate O-acetylesterase [Rudaea sp.]|nr:sialate O-acetylesterase [Rudaea sp.]